MKLSVKEWNAFIFVKLQSNLWNPGAVCLHKLISLTLD